MSNFHLSNYKICWFFYNLWLLTTLPKKAVKLNSLTHPVAIGSFICNTLPLWNISFKHANTIITSWPWLLALPGHHQIWYQGSKELIVYLEGRFEVPLASQCQRMPYPLEFYIFALKILQSSTKPSMWWWHSLFFPTQAPTVKPAPSHQLLQVCLACLSWTVTTALSRTWMSCWGCVLAGSLVPRMVPAATCRHHSGHHCRHKAAWMNYWGCARGSSQQLLTGELEW